jgi:two-component system nitrate/nitrite sensor histidine kinase NarX
MIRLAGAQAGTVRVVTSDGAHMRLVGSQGLTPEVVAQEQLVPLDCGLCGAAVSDDAVRQSSDLQHCAARTATDYFRELGAAVVVPLTHMGQVLGAYTLFFAEKRDTPEELGLLFRSISEHLGMALENARLLRENMRMTLVRERQLMANEVHDSLAQTMAYMKIRLAMMQEALDASEQARASKHAGEVQQALDGAYADLRELLSHFRNRMDPLGLVHALEELKTKFHDRTGIELAFDNRTTGLDLSVEEEGQVFHIMQEALANVARHSGAKHARLTMELADGDYRFTVEDDGLGFYAFGQRRDGAEQHSHLRHHLGVNIMRERAQHLDGRIEISNLPQGGARVSLVFSAQRETGA